MDEGRHNQKLGFEGEKHSQLTVEKWKVKLIISLLVRICYAAQFIFEKKQQFFRDKSLRRAIDENVCLNLHEGEYFGRYFLDRILADENEIIIVFDMLVLDAIF